MQAFIETVLRVAASAACARRAAWRSGPARRGGHIPRRIHRPVPEYTFTARTLPAAITGTVLIDDEGHVRSLETTVSSDLITAPKAVTPVTAGTTTHASALGTAAHLTVTFGDFGVPVSTTPPAAGQVDNLGANYLALVGRSKFEIIPADLSATSPAASTPIPPNPLTSLSPSPASEPLQAPSASCQLVRLTAALPDDCSLGRRLLRSGRRLAD
jgi:hypothetical protein